MSVNNCISSSFWQRVQAVKVYMFVLLYFSTYWSLQRCHLCVAAGILCAIMMMHIRVRTKYTIVRALMACAVCLSCRYVTGNLDCMKNCGINGTLHIMTLQAWMEDSTAFFCVCHIMMKWSSHLTVHKVDYRSTL